MVPEVSKDGGREMKNHFLGDSEVMYFTNPDISRIQNLKYCNAYFKSRLV